jgi:type I restriction enzyme M protein
MTQEDVIQTILKDSNYHLSLFSEDEISALRKKIIVKESKGKKTPFVPCIVRDKDIQLKPEEVVRQLYAARLIQQYGYPKKRLAFEYDVTFGREKKSADIVVFDKDRPDTPYIIVELKKPKLKGDKDNSGDYVYLKNSNGQQKLDKNGHLIVDHDLHNHGGELPDGIAEAFIEFAKSEKLSFWK